MALASARVLVLQDNVYMKAILNDTVTAKRGDIVDIASGWYVDKMCEQGLVHYLSEGDDVEQILRDTEPVMTPEEQAALDAESDTHVVDGVLDPSSPLVRRKASK